MPSHQIRVQQNNCDHLFFPTFYGSEIKCSKCGLLYRLILSESIKISIGQEQDQSAKEK